MRDFNIRELQLKELSILEEVDRICRKYHIKYFLSYGTALGAIRHKGFIPWDDDIDLCMKLADYHMFKKVCKKELNSAFFYQDIESDPYVHITWAKIRENNTTSLVKEMADFPIHWGICIDIFPLLPIVDKHLSKIDMFAFKLMNLCANKKLNAYGYGDYGVLSSKTKWIPSMFCARLYQFSKSYFLRNRKKTNYYLEYSEGILRFRIYEASIWEDIILVPFENGEYPIMKEYDRYLTQIYGCDYMQIPDVKDQIGHGDIIVDTKCSYHKYMKQRGEKATI